MIDTSGLLAALDPRQEHHVSAARVLMQPRRRILSPFVLAELDYLISSHAGQGEATKLRRDVARGVYELESISVTDVAEALRVVERYADLRVGLADATIVVLADRFGCCDILTLDQRHFRVISGSSGKPFRLLPLDEAS